MCLFLSFSLAPLSRATCANNIPDRSWPPRLIFLIYFLVSWAILGMALFQNQMLEETKTDAIDPGAFIINSQMETTPGITGQTGLAFALWHPFSFLSSSLSLSLLLSPLFFTTCHATLPSRLERAKGKERK